MFFLSIAFRMVSSLRIQATSTAVVITPMPLMLLRCSAGSLKWFRMWVFIFQRFDDINVFFALRVSRVQPVLLSNWHCDQLVSANDYGIKNLTFCIRQSPDKAVSFRMVINNCSHLGKKTRIMRVSLRQISHRTGKVTSLPGVNYGDLKTFGLKRTGYGGLPSTQRPYRAASVQR